MSITFTPYAQPDEAAKAIQDLLFDKPDALPGDIRTQTRSFLHPGSSISFAIAYFAELLYARLSEVTDPDALQVGAAAALYGATNYVDNLGGARGQQISLHLRKASGETAPTGGWKLADPAPEPRENFLATA